jgi:hypothetical protein
MFFAAPLVADRPRPPEPPKPPEVKYPHINTTTGYRVDPAWPKGKSSYLWEAMAGTAVDRDGLIWTINRGRMPVQVYDRDGNLYLGDIQGRRVQKFVRIAEGPAD